MLEIVTIEKFDVYEGIVISTNRRGAIIKLLGSDIEAFCFCSANIGDRLLVSISKIDLDKNSVRCRVDSYCYSAA